MLKAILGPGMRGEHDAVYHDVFTRVMIRLNTTVGETNYESSNVCRCPTTYVTPHAYGSDNS